MRSLAAIALLIALLFGKEFPLTAELPVSVPVFVKRYCIKCHDADREKGDRNFEPFLEQPSKAEHHSLLKEILDQLNLGEMPPRKKHVVQPPNMQRRQMIAALANYLAAIQSSNAPTATVMRRLTRYEYNYTLRDLLGVDTIAADATRLFPADNTSHGFPNYGPVQALSDVQLQHYIKAARTYLERALVMGKQRPEVRRWIFKPKDLIHEKKNVGTVRYRVISADGKYLDIGHGKPAENGPTYPKKFAAQGVPVDGFYRIRVKATAVGRKHPYAPELIPADLTQPLQMGLWHVPGPTYLAKRTTEGRVLVKVFDLVDNNPKNYEVKVWMPAGSIPFIHWINGIGASKGPLRKIIQRYYPEARRKTAYEVDRLKADGLPVPKDALVQKIWVSDLYKGPRVRVFEITLEGPLHDQWPPASHRSIVGYETDASRVNVEQVLLKFARKSFRHPVKLRDIAQYIDFIKSETVSGMATNEALKQALTAILTSPRFLFLDEGGAQGEKQLNDFQLATRLSYALWCSTPDERLLKLAADGVLHKPKNLYSETERLLKDPRSQAFVQHFADAWLRLDKIGSMPPGTKQFPVYFRDRLESAMKKETYCFVNHVLQRNHPISEFVDSSYSFLNGALARHYGVPGVVGEAFRKVEFPSQVRRGGLLGHASVLTATANGVETSPVSRGVWVLESLLGTPPSPPPPDVPPIEPDTRGAVTIREQLAKHRHVAACADCHAKIDPWGFALEFYDPIGGLRVNYSANKERGKGKGLHVDGSGQLPSGEKVYNEADLRKLLASRKTKLTRNLTHKLVLHATGRKPGYRDHDVVNQIVEQSLASGNGFRDLIHAVIMSELFARR
ncbi:MAG TPA: hypothetical protein DCO70_09965 [Verrucomicrobiales bacterium]|nr:hypothetical protein [Verrucomicrobiales bacterium]